MPFFRFMRSLTGLILLASLFFLALYLEQKSKDHGFPPSASRHLNTQNSAVIDGDSLKLGSQEVRLFGVDAPEYRQECRNHLGKTYPCGQLATKALTAIVKNQPLTCIIHSQDQYGRAVAICETTTTNVNEALVRQGWAVAYRQHSSHYIAAENEARTHKRGLWQGAFEWPWDYRKEKRFPPNSSRFLSEE